MTDLKIIRRKSLLCGIAICLLLTALGGAYLYRSWPSHSRLQTRQAFDTILWKEDNYENRYRNRSSMVDDLLSHTLRKGMRREQVIDILGTPNIGGESGVAYEVGAYYPKKYRSEKGDELTLTFDRQKKLEKAEIIRSPD